MDTFYSLLDQYGLWAIALGSFFQSFVFVILQDSCRRRHSEYFGHYCCGCGEFLGRSLFFLPSGILAQ